MRVLRLAVVLTSFVSVGVWAGCSKNESNEGAATPPPKAETDVKAATEAPPATIKIGQTMAYSGPASAYGTIGRAQAAYFKKINEEGGIDGKQIQFISLDDGYSPPKAVEHVRRLVEQDEVVAVFNSVGTAANSAVHAYLNSKQVPQLFVSTGASKWADPEGHPWTIGFNPSYVLEGKTYADHILATRPKAKIAVLYQSDDYGKDLLKGLRDGLGSHANMIVAESSYQISDATIDSQIATLQASKADTFVDIATPKFAAQAVRRIHDIGWKPTHYLNQVGASIASVIRPVGADKAVGAMTVGYFKDPIDPQYENDPEMQRFKAFMKKYYPDGDPEEGTNAYAYVAAQTLVQVLKQCEHDISRQNIMRQAANLHDFHPELLQTGININTAPGDFALFDKVQLSRFDGKNWRPLESAGATAARATR